MEDVKLRLVEFLENFFETDEIQIYSHVDSFCIMIGKQYKISYTNESNMFMLYNSVRFLDVSNNYDYFILLCETHFNRNNNETVKLY